VQGPPVAGGESPVSISGAPHVPQKLNDAGEDAPHAPQARSTADPHVPQYRKPGGLDRPQVGHSAKVAGPWGILATGRFPTAEAYHLGTGGCPG
jgi:hypothetical protein